MPSSVDNRLISFVLQKALDRGIDPTFCTHTASARNFYNMFWIETQMKTCKFIKSQCFVFLSKKTRISRVTVLPMKI